MRIKAIYDIKMLNETDKQGEIRSMRDGENARFLGACQEYILDKKAPDTRFDQCLQGFCV
jgi:hypothetical protein